MPLALIVTVLVQTAAGGWWAATISSRVESNRENINRIEGVVDATRASAATQAVQLGRIEEQITGLRGDIMRLLTVVERQAR